jgi:hypothetical protein
MTTGGWIFMVASIGFVLWLTGYAYSRVLRKPSAANHMHAPIDIDTQDKGT